MIDPKHNQLSLSRQCTLVSISRSTFYYRPRGENPLNLALMRLVDEQYLAASHRMRQDIPWPLERK